MAVITRLVASKGRSKKVKVYLDGKCALSLEPEVAIEAKLRVHRELDQSQLNELEKQNEMKRALAAANRFLGFRPRSERELKQKLAQKGFDADIVAAALARLKELGLVDDAAFARYWAENRAAFSPRSRSLVTLELRQKGVNAGAASECAGELDDESAAYAAAAKRASRISVNDYEEFRRKLGEYLRRRGFGYEVINATVKRLWDELAHKE